MVKMVDYLDWSHFIKSGLLKVWKTSGLMKQVLPLYTLVGQPDPYPQNRVDTLRSGMVINLVLKKENFFQVSLGVKGRDRFYV